MAKASNKKNKKDNKYNAENEIIIGVTTKPNERVRVDKKTTRTSAKSTQKKNTKGKKSSLNRKKTTLNKRTSCNKNVNNKEIPKEDEIKKINGKKIAISISILLFIAIGGTIYYLTTPAFNIANIEVHGNEKNSVETYISLSRINIGSTNIFGITSGNIIKYIKENSYVENVTVKRKLPNTIELYITERKVSYQINYSNSYIYLDNQGYILEISEEKKDIPIIKGLSSIKENIQIGQRLKEEDLIKLNVVFKIINYCKYNTIENKITSIDVTDGKNYILIFEEEQKKVYLGDASNISERLSMLKTILKNETGKKGEIFMNGDLKEDKVYFREEKQ